MSGEVNPGAVHLLGPNGVPANKAQHLLAAERAKATVLQSALVD